MYVSPTNAGGTLGSNGTWSGVIGELVSQKADVALFPLTRTASRLAAVDCTFSYYDAGLALLVGDGQTAPGPLSVLAPFEMTLWVTLLCTVIGVALLFWALDAYGRWIRSKQFDALRASGVLSEKAVARAKKEEGNPVMISLMAAAGAPERPGRNSWGVQVLYVVYCFFCLIVLSSYTANLTSYLAVRRAYVGVSGLQDLIRENSQVGVNPGGSTAAYFANSKDSLAMQLQPNVRYCDTPTCVSWVREGVVRAFVTDQPVLLYLSQQQPCNTAVAGDPFGPGNLVIGLQKNSPLMPLFNSAMQSFAEDGTLTSLRRAWFDGLSQCVEGSGLDNTRLTVSQMLGAFVFLVMGVVMAFITGTVENLKWCLARAYAKSYSEAAILHTARSFGAGGGGGDPEGGQPLPRGAVLMQQASRLRAATWRRLSVGLLGIPTPPPQAEMEERRSWAAAAGSAVAPLTVQPSGSSTTLRGSGAIGRSTDPGVLPPRSRAFAATVSAAVSLAAVERSYPSYVGGSGGSGGAVLCNVGASPSRDVLLVLQDCGSGKAAAAGVSCGGAGGSGIAGESGGGSPGGGSPLSKPQLLPMMPSMEPLLNETSVPAHHRRDTDWGLLGQPSMRRGGNSTGSGTPGTPPATPMLPSAAMTAPAMTAAAAATSGRMPTMPSSLRSIRVAPSRGSSCNGLVRGEQGQLLPYPQHFQPQQHQQQQQVALPPPLGPASVTATATAERPSSCTQMALPQVTELMTFSHVSSSNAGEAEGGRGSGASGPAPISLSFTTNAAPAAPAAVAERVEAVRRAFPP